MDHHDHRQRDTARVSTHTRVRHSTGHPGHPVVKAVAVVVALLLGFGLAYYQTLASQLGSAINVRENRHLIDGLPELPDLPQAPSDGSAGTAVNILLMGSDVRDGSNA